MAGDPDPCCALITELPSDPRLVPGLGDAPPVDLSLARSCTTQKGQATSQLSVWNKLNSHGCLAKAAAVVGRTCHGFRVPSGTRHEQNETCLRSTQDSRSLDAGVPGQRLLVVCERHEASRAGNLRSSPPGNIQSRTNNHSMRTMGRTSLLRSASTLLPKRMTATQSHIRVGTDGSAVAHLSWRRLHRAVRRQTPGPASPAPAFANRTAQSAPRNRAQR
jgi:hypothetical protein